MKKIALLTILFIFSFSFSYAASSEIDKKLDKMYSKAEKAIELQDYKQADFWIAQYLGITITTKDTNKDYSTVVPLFYKMSERLKATNFISGKFSNDFLSFFFLAPQSLWAVPEKNITDGNMILARSNIDQDRKYVCVFKMRPILQTWSILGGENKPVNMVAPFGDGQAKPEITAGIIENNDVRYFDPVKIDSDLDIQFVWHIKFYDLNNDNIPEIWVRYNLAGGSGFTQRLDIYKIVMNKELKLLKRFEGPAEGIAIRLDDGKIQTGYGYSENKSSGHLGYEKTMLETWEYKEGEFVKIDQRSVPHILWGNEWEKYYKM